MNKKNSSDYGYCYLTYNFLKIHSILSKSVSEYKKIRVYRWHPKYLQHIRARLVFHYL